MVKTTLGKIKGAKSSLSSVNTIGGSYVLPPSVKPTKEQIAEVNKVKKEMMNVEKIKKAKGDKEAKSWLDEQARKKKLTTKGWSEYKMLFA